MISIIAPCYNEVRFIDGFLDAVAGFQGLEEPFELLVVDGLSTDGTRERLASAQDRWSWMRMIDNPKRITPNALNIGIGASRGEFIVRLDIHANYPADYLAKLIWWARKTGADNVGGLCRGESVSEQTPTAFAIKKVFEDWLGVGNSVFRVGASGVREVDTVPFGCYRREVFTRVGLFDQRLVRCQDYEFNSRLRALGGRILLVPEIVCTYFPRSTYLGLWKNRFATGKGVALVPYYIRSLRATGFRHAVPMLFVIALILPLLVAWLWRPLAFVSLGVAGIYLVAICLRSSKLSDKQAPAGYVAVAFAILHFSYGFGSLAGVFEVLWRMMTKGRSVDIQGSMNG